MSPTKPPGVACATNVCIQLRFVSLFSINLRIVSFGSILSCFFYYPIMLFVSFYPIPFCLYHPLGFHKSCHIRRGPPRYYPCFSVSKTPSLRLGPPRHSPRFRVSQTPSLRGGPPRYYPRFRVSQTLIQQLGAAAGPPLSSADHIENAGGCRDN